MRYFGITLFCLLAERSSATNNCSPKIMEEFKFIPEYMKSAVNKLPVPALNFGDNSAGKFRTAFLTAITDYGIDLMCNTYSQADARSNDLVTDIQEDYKQLKKLIESITEKNKKQICMDDALKKLTAQEQILLDLKPGNQKIKPPTLPPVPEQQILVESRTTELTLNDTFLNAVLLVDHVAGQAHGYFNYLYLTGWNDTRQIFEAIRLRLYDDFLNTRVLNVYKEIVEKVCEDENVVREHVLPQTWKSFREVKDCIIKISNDYNASKE